MVANASGRTLSVLVPTVSPNIKSAPILQSWPPELVLPFSVQFVFLVNSRQARPPVQVASERMGSHEILSISTDQYFGSCEENIQRSADFLDKLGDCILIVGDHDLIDWTQLVAAVNLFYAEHLDALAINIKACQERPSGAMIAMDSLVPPVGASRNLQSFGHLFEGQTMTSSFAFPALISCLGPIDWAAFIGSHVYGKELFRRLLMYKTSESVYSLVYKQLRLFADIPCRYALYAGTPIHRISSEFMQMTEGSHSWGWLVNHRAVLGASPCFWVANMQYLNELTDPTLFALVAYSRCFSIVLSSEGAPAYSRSYFLWNCLYWSVSVVNHRLSGRSYYLPGEVSSGDLSDVHIVNVFLAKLLALVEQDYALYRLHGHAFLQNVRRSIDCTGAYLRTLDGDLTQLQKAVISLEAARADLSGVSLQALNELTFDRHHAAVSVNAHSPIESLKRRTRLSFWKFRVGLEARLTASSFKAKCRVKSIVSRLKAHA